MPFSLLAHDAALGVLKELDDLLDLRSVGHLVFDLVDDVEDARLSMEQQPIGVGDVLLHLLVDAGLAHHRGIGTAIFERLTASDDKWGDVERERGACLYHSQTANAGVGILNGRAGEDDAIVHFAVTCNLHTITEHTVIAHDRIVADMRTFEQEVVVADDGTTVTMGTAVDDDILADDIVITNLHV